MRSRDLSTRKIFVRPDLTPAQLDADKKLRQELLIKGKDKFMIHRGKIVLRPGAVIAASTSAPSTSAPAPNPDTMAPYGTSVAGSMHATTSTTTSAPAVSAIDPVSVGAGSTCSTATGLPSGCEAPTAGASVQQVVMGSSTPTDSADMTAAPLHIQENAATADKETTTRLSVASRTSHTPIMSDKASPLTHTSSASKSQVKSVSSQKSTTTQGASSKKKSTV